MEIPGKIFNLYGGAMPEMVAKELSVIQAVFLCATALTLVYFLSHYENKRLINRY